MKKREDLVNAALSICYADGGSGQSADPEDFQFVNERVPVILGSLSSRNVYPYGDPDQIEEDAFEYLSICLANMQSVSRRFGSAVDNGAVSDAETKLREITAETLSYQPLKAEYF